MLSRLARLLFTASSIAPVSFTYAWVAYMQSQPSVAIWAAALGIIAVDACVLLLAFAQRNIEAFEFAPQTIEAADTESLGFMLLYLLPLFTEQVGNLHWELWVPIIVVFAVIVGTGHGYHFNPLLGLAQWHFYKVTSSDGVTYVLITKKHLRTAAGHLKVGQLTDYMLLDLGGK
jgi:hypothetical protein